MFFCSSSALKLKVLMVRVWPAKGLSSAIPQTATLSTSTSITAREMSFFMTFSSCLFSR